MGFALSGTRRPLACTRCCGPRQHHDACLLAAWPVQIMKWLLQRLRPRETDSNKEYASEILTILIQVRLVSRLGDRKRVRGQTWNLR